MEIDPNKLSVDGLSEEVQRYGNVLDEVSKDQEAESMLQQQQQSAEQEAVSEQEDPRNAKNWGAKAFAKELVSIGAGGLQDTASSITTFPDRTVDALTGEIQREREEKIAGGV